jgi:hypothetical protein
MWRTALLIFFSLLTCIGGMLFWQWKAFSKQDPIHHLDQAAKQEISVYSDSAGLTVTQKVSGLEENKEYSPVVPENIADWSCVKADGSPCAADKSHSNTFSPENSELIFVYKIPVSGDEESFLLNDWTVTLPDIRFSSSSIEIIDEARRAGTWAAGAALDGFEEMNIIDYYYFTAIGSTPSLYWQSSPLSSSMYNGVMVYSNKETKVSFPEELGNQELPFTALIMTDLHKEAEGEGILIVPNGLTDIEYKQKVVRSFFLNKFQSLHEGKNILAEVFTSLIMNLPAQSDKAIAMVQDLKSRLTQDQIAALTKRVRTMENITAGKLDNSLSETAGYLTSFFSLNSENADHVPLYFYDHRKLVLDGKKHDQIELMIENGKRLYPFIETMKGLGYSIEKLPDQESLLVKKGKSSYRFFLDRNIFIYNEEDYGLLERPLVLFNGKIYMEEKWIESLFHLSVDEGEKTVTLSI